MHLPSRLSQTKLVYSTFDHNVFVASRRFRWLPSCRICGSVGELCVELDVVVPSDIVLNEGLGGLSTGALGRLPDGHSVHNDRHRSPNGTDRSVVSLNFLRLNHAKMCQTTDRVGAKVRFDICSRCGSTVSVVFSTKHWQTIQLLYEPTY